jgi:hypothetical protein
MSLVGKFLVLWLAPEVMETFLGILDPDRESTMASWTVAALVVGESGPGLWLRVHRVIRPNGEDFALPEEPVYFLRWDLVTTARLYETMPTDVRRIG